MLMFEYGSSKQKYRIAVLGRPQKKRWRCLDMYFCKIDAIGLFF